MKASALFDAVAAACQAALPSGWTAVAGQAPDNRDQTLDMALYDATSGGYVYGAYEMRELLSVRLSLANRPSTTEAYRALLDLRDTVALAVLGCLVGLSGQGITLTDATGILPPATPVDTANNSIVWSQEIRFGLLRRMEGQ